MMKKLLVFLIETTHLLDEAFFMSINHMDFFTGK
jgi:hypothetical protein